MVSNYAGKEDGRHKSSSNRRQSHALKAWTLGSFVISHQEEVGVVVLVLPCKSDCTKYRSKRSAGWKTNGTSVVQARMHLSIDSRWPGERPLGRHRYLKNMELTESCLREASETPLDSVPATCSGDNLLQRHSGWLIQNQRVKPGEPGTEFSLH